MFSLIFQTYAHLDLGVRGPTSKDGHDTPGSCTNPALPTLVSQAIILSSFSMPFDDKFNFEREHLQSQNKSCMFAPQLCSLLDFD